jgi:Tol biopolymer transport system component
VNRGTSFVAAVLVGAALVSSASPAGRTSTLTGLIAFESTRTGNSDIWIAKPDGTGLTNLTKTPRLQESTPALSPDGRRIAFVRSSGERYRLWVMNVDGSGQRTLGASKGSDLNPVWSPSGDRVAFATLVGRNWDVWVTTDSGLRTQLTTDAAAEVDISWEPSGRRLVVDRITKGTSDLWRVSVPDGKLDQLTRTPRVAELNPAWSPKGDRIAYDAAVGGAYDLFTLELESGRVVRITRDAADDGDPVWAPDASTLAYRRGVGPDYEIATVDASGTGKPRNVSPSARGIDIAPSWSIDARAIARAPSASSGATLITWTFACDVAWPGTPEVDNYWGNLNVNYMCGAGKGDTIHGSDGGDWLSGGGGNDHLYGQKGIDKLKARDLLKDYAYGGDQTDYALLDASDVTDVEYPSY